MKSYVVSAGSTNLNWLKLVVTELLINFTNSLSSASEKDRKNTYIPADHRLVLLRGLRESTTRIRVSHRTRICKNLPEHSMMFSVRLASWGGLWDHYHPFLRAPRLGWTAAAPAGRRFPGRDAVLKRSDWSLISGEVDSDWSLRSGGAGSPVCLLMLRSLLCPQL